MKSQRIITTCLIVASVAVLALVSSCGDDSPTGGGGLPAKELDSGNMPTGASYLHTFNTAGTFNYHCEIHGAGMSGQVIVVNGSADSALVTIGPGNAYSPAATTVKPTGYVRWINIGSAHTVTSN